MHKDQGHNGKTLALIRLAAKRGAWYDTAENGIGKEGVSFMETYLICIAVALVGGLMMSRLTKLVNLPAVTAYLVAGLLLGPFFLGRLNIPGLGFQSLEQV